jgi:hypothetical protein
MPAIGNQSLTLADHAKRQDANGKVAKIVEILGQTNEILTDMLWLEGNLATGHRTTVRTGLPAATWRCPSAEQSGRFEAAVNGGFGASGFAV